MTASARSNATGSVNQRVNGPRLLIDVGENDACFALETGPGEMCQLRTYACANYSSVIELIRQYLDDVEIDRVSHAAMAIAEMVDGDRISIGKHGWIFSIETTRRMLGFDALIVVNDAEARAMALPFLTDSQRVQVGNGIRRPNRVIGLISPGAALGVSALIPSADRWIELNSAGGHASFAPCDEREDQVLRYARSRWAHVSFERVASNQGIEVIYQALAASANACTKVDTSRVIQQALAGEPLAAEAIDVFCGILGTFASDIAMTLGSLGGIYIDGVVPQLGELFQRSAFRRRFEAKGRFEPLHYVPTYVITAERLVLLGVSAILAERLPNFTGRSSTAVFDRIRQMRDGLTSAERRVADLALQHPRSIINASVIDIARKAEVGSSTVIRFCRSLGWPTLSDFKLKLATGLTATIPITHSQVRPNEAAIDFGAKVLDNTISAMRQLREHLNFEHVEQTIELLSHARRIEFYGLGNSNVIAQDAHYKFFRFGIPTISHGDPYMQAASAALLGKEDVIVMVSRLGQAPELLRVLDVAMKAGAKVIAITSSDTPLARRATVALEKDRIEIDVPQISMISRILHLVMIDILAVGVAIRRARYRERVEGVTVENRGYMLSDGAMPLDWLSHSAAASATDLDTPAFHDGIKQGISLTENTQV